MLTLMSDSFLFDAGWLFFAAWSVVVAVVSVTAFGRDFLPSRGRLELAHQDQAPEAARSTDLHLR
jgi:hypothetical protein